MADDLNDMEQIKPEGRHGFLPMDTNWFDRFFISAILTVAIHLFWLRFIEPMGITLWVAMAISLALGFFIMRKG